MVDTVNNLFGEEFKVELPKSRVKDLVKKIDDADCEELEEDRIDKILRSKKTTIQERLKIITDKVLRVLGKQKANVVVIKTKEQLIDYIDKAIKVGRIAVDTETNNSLDPVTCKHMGLCLYVPGEKQAYIPLNHRDPVTKERLDWQLTEEDCREQLQRIVDAKTFVVMHNGKFDFEVIRSTCHIDIVPDWDTMVAARLIDENELAGLKSQYIAKIDKSQAKYDIEKLFKTVAYADVDPEIFALYAATDSMMTDKLYLYQKPIMESTIVYNEDGTIAQHGIYWLFKTIEMPIVIVTADMELRGVAVDRELGARLKEKYGTQLSDLDKALEADLAEVEAFISKWKLDPETSATERTRQYEPKKSKKTRAEIEEAYPYVDEKLNKRYKIGKSMVDQLTSPLNLQSPVQLGIIFYNVLECPPVSKKSPRGTGRGELAAIKAYFEGVLAKHEADEEVSEADFAAEMEEAKEEGSDASTESIDAANIDTEKAKLALKLADAILKRRGLVKLITTYIDVIPDLTKHWPDGRIRFHLNSLGTDTGRYSSGGKLKFMENDEAVEVSGINIQNIPSHNKEIRMLFCAKTDEGEVECQDDCYEIDDICEVETKNGWKFGKELVNGDIIINEDGIEEIIELIAPTASGFILKVNLQAA